MKKIFQETAFYYIIIPLIVALWPLLVWQRYLPRVSEKWNDEEKQFIEAGDLMKQILYMDGERLNFDDKKRQDKFDYTTAVDTAARKVGISSADYTISSKPIHGLGRNKTQDCQIVIRETDIERFAKFLSNIQTTWASLQCEKVTLSKKKGLPDSWKIDLTFKYYY